MKRNASRLTFLARITLMFALTLAPVVRAQSPTQQSPAKQDVTIVIQQQQVRFTTPQPVDQMHLEVRDQAGEVVFDSGAASVLEINWQLQYANGTPLKSGLYAYTLTLKDAGAKTARVRRGHFIVDRAQDRDGTDKLWVTSPNTSGIGTELTVARDENAVVAGTTTGGERTLGQRGESSNRTGGGRELDTTTQLQTAAAKTATVALTAGTAGKIAKFTSGTDLGNSVMTELNGGIGINMTPLAGYGLGVTGNTYLKTSGGGEIVFGTPNAETGMSIVKDSKRADVRFDGAALSLRARGAEYGGPPTQGIVIRTTGNVGIGTENPQNLLQVGPGRSSILASRVNAVVASNSPDAGIAIAQNSGVNVLVQASGAGGYIGTTSNHPLVLRTNDQDTVVIDSFATTIYAADLRLGHASRRGAPGRALVDNGDELVVNWAKDWARTTIGSDLNVLGRMTTQVLQITGGADFAENFDVNVTEAAALTLKVEAGMVVAIDPANPGKLQLSTQAYNRRVAGIISGAGGIKPGMMMSQAGTLADGQHPVALTGRVYCWVDATQGAIEPGDLLTTSTTPGHAMKAADAAQAQGAIIGKAMTGLKAGKGLVLVLVTLQ